MTLTFCKYKVVTSAPKGRESRTKSNTINLDGTSGKEPTCQCRFARDLGSIPGEGNGNSLQYSCLGNLMDRGAWWTTLHGVTNNQT